MVRRVYGQLFVEQRLTNDGDRALVYVEGNAQMRKYEAEDGTPQNSLSITQGKSQRGEMERSVLIGEIVSYRILQNPLAREEGGNGE